MKDFLKTIELSLEEKISFTKDYQRTFNNWKSNYIIRMNEFVNNYEDNSEIIFIENEIENVENTLLQLDQALKDNYFEKDSFDLFDTNPLRDLYIDVRIESAIKSKSTYKKIKNFLEERKQEIELCNSSETTPRIEHITHQEPKSKKLPEKWYALHYLLETMAHGKEVPKDIDGDYKKSEIQNIGKKRCESHEKKSSGQLFYKYVREIDLNNPINLKNEFAKEWMNIILELSKNDQITLDYINKKYK